MADWRDDKPRAHHYEFAHRALPRVALDPRADLVALAADGRIDRALHATWTAIAERSPVDDRLDVAGLSASVVDLGGGQALLVTFPDATHMTEAIMALVAPLEPATARRYFVLERSWDVVGDRPATVLGEWREGHHYNLGSVAAALAG